MANHGADRENLSLSARPSNNYSRLTVSSVLSKSTVRLYSALTKSGILEKRGHAYRQQWRKRWFDLTGSQILKYYTLVREGKGTLRGTFRLTRFTTINGIVESGDDERYHQHSLISRLSSRSSLPSMSTSAKFGFLFNINNAVLESGDPIAELSFAAETIHEKFEWMEALQVNIFNDILTTFERLYKINHLLTSVEVLILFPIELSFKKVATDDDDDENDITNDDRYLSIANANDVNFSEVAVKRKAFVVPGKQPDSGCHIRSIKALGVTRPLLKADTILTAMHSTLLKEDQQYTIIMINPDFQWKAGDAKDCFVHFLVVNSVILPDHTLSCKDCLCEYLPPCPTYNSGSNRIMLLVFQQFEEVDTEIINAMEGNFDRCSVTSIPEFHRSLGLGPLVALNVFTAQWEPHVDFIHEFADFVPHENHKSPEREKVNPDELIELTEKQFLGIINCMKSAIDEKNHLKQEKESLHREYQRLAKLEQRIAERLGEEEAEKLLKPEVVPSARQTPISALGLLNKMVSPTEGMRTSTELRPSSAQIVGSESKNSLSKSEEAQTRRSSSAMRSRDHDMQPSEPHMGDTEIAKRTTSRSHSRERGQRRINKVISGEPTSRQGDSDSVNSIETSDRVALKRSSKIDNQLNNTRNSSDHGDRPSDISKANQSSGNVGSSIGGAFRSVAKHFNHSGTKTVEYSEESDSSLKQELRWSNSSAETSSVIDLQRERSPVAEKRPSRLAHLVASAGDGTATGTKTVMSHRPVRSRGPPSSSPSYSFQAPGMLDDGVSRPDSRLSNNSTSRTGESLKTVTESDNGTHSDSDHSHSSVLNAAFSMFGARRSRTKDRERDSESSRDSQTSATATHTKSSALSTLTTNFVGSLRLSLASASADKERSSETGSSVTTALHQKYAHALGTKVTTIFSGVWALKKLMYETTYRKRFIFVDPAQGTFHWKKTDKADDYQKLIHLKDTVRVRLINSEDGHLNIELKSGPSIDIKVDHAVDWAIVLEKLRIL